MSRGMTRRELLKRTAFAGTAITGFGLIEKVGSIAASEQAPQKSRVIIVKNQAILKNNSIDQKTAEKMLGQAIAKLTGKSSGVEAWKSLFKPSDVVGIKVNCLFGKGASTHPEIAYAVAAGLKLAGVKPENIIIWDRSTGDLAKTGYVPNRGSGIQVIADDGDWGEEVKLRAFHGRLSKIITQKITALVNVPILKTHEMTGMSGALKNHYGSFDNPGAAHGDGGNPWMADLNALPQIKEKTRLIVMDTVKPQCDRGPGLDTNYQFDYHSIIVSKDPLAIDRVGLDIINERRKQLGRPELTVERIKWFGTAESNGVGTCDPSKIEIIKL